MLLPLPSDSAFLDQRREAISQDDVQIGLDFVQVMQVVPPAGGTTWDLRLSFILAPGKPGKVLRPAPTLRLDQIEISAAAPLTSANLQVRAIVFPDDPAVLTVRVGPGADSALGVRDLALYRIRLLNVVNLDPFFDSALFSLTTVMTVEIGPRGAAADGDTRAQARPQIDYLSKDYASFRLVMLNRLAEVIPGWSATSPADLAVTLVEVLAYAADQLSYYQDAVATEAYLGTARQRPSVRRHARLLDYHLAEGCNARAWIHFEVKSATVVPVGTLLMTNPVSGLPSGPGLSRSEFDDAVAEGAVVFQTLEPAHMEVDWNRLLIYGWGAQTYVLPAGTTSASLLRPLGSGRATLQSGDVLLFEEIASSDRDVPVLSTRRQAVRLTGVDPTSDPLGAALGDSPFGADEKGVPIVNVTWALEDALQFDLPVYGPGHGYANPLGVARGNLVLADHGLPVTEPLPRVHVPATYRPVLQETNLTFRVPFDPEAARDQPASVVVGQDPATALPTVRLAADAEVWSAQRDLLTSTWASRDFVVEMEGDRTAHLRFGDGTFGERPHAGTMFVSDYRTGNGVAGNVGSDTIRHYLCPDINSSVLKVRNPLPGAGGTDPEPLEQARLNASHSFQVQERCVTESDYVGVAERHPQVKKARATTRWTGSWPTTFLAVDRRGNRPVDPWFRDSLQAFMRPYLLLGADLAILGPHFVALDIALEVHSAPGFAPGNLKVTLLEVFSSVDLPDGSRGYFHPDNLSFGQSIYLSQLVDRAAQVPGVTWLKALRFGRWHDPSMAPLEIILIGPLEIARVDNNPNALEHGQITFSVVED